MNMAIKEYLNWSPENGSDASEGLYNMERKAHGDENCQIFQKNVEVYSIIQM